AQTVWYIPTGLDPWNQLLGKAPGHYTRLYSIAVNQEAPAPMVHWPDQEPLRVDGSLAERLNHWLTLVQRGEVLTSYRVFLGLLDDARNRKQVLAQLAFAGLIDVQDRMLHNRSYTTGHKSYRARATIQLGEALGWAAAQVILDTGHPNNFSMSQHGYEYCNTLGWFYDTFEHPHRLKLLFVAASFINRAAEHQANTPDNGRRAITPPPGAEGLSPRSLLERLEATIIALRPDEAVGLTA